MVTKLDRFARTALSGTELIKDLLQNGIKVHVLNMGLVEDTATGRKEKQQKKCFNLRKSCHER